MSDLIKRAEVFAHEAHAGVKRMFSGEPYIVHPKAVAGLVEEAGLGEAVIAAAWLHDVVEDCDVSPAKLEAEFGAEIAGLVVAVSNHFSSASGLSRVVRKEREAERLAAVSPAAQSIKVADIIDNCANVAERSPKFAAKYLPEKEAQLAVLVKASPALLVKAWKIFEESN